MTKLRFDNLSLQGFNSFKLIEKKRKPRVNNDKRLTKLVRGVCIREGEDFKLSIDIKALKPDIIDNSHPDLLVLDFTEESYNLKGVQSIFTRKPDDKGRYTRIIRTESQAKFSGNVPEVYVPFCRNWICSGYVVRRNGKLMFDFNECIAPQGYTVIEQIEYE